MDSKKHGADVTDLGCSQVQIGTATLPDGTQRPIYEAKAHAPEAYRRFLKIVTNEGHHVAD